MINIYGLTKELITAGISKDGNCNSAGIVWDDDGNEIQNRSDVIAILEAHDPSVYEAELEQLKSNIADAHDRLSLSIFQNKTPQQIEDYLRTRMTEGAWVNVPLEVRQDLGEWIYLLASAAIYLNGN